MGRERLAPGTAGEITYKTVVRTETKSVNGVETTMSKKVVVVRCRYRDPYGTYSQPQATGTSREAARRALTKRLNEMPVVAVTSLNLDSAFGALVDERIRQIDASDTLANSTKHQYTRTLNNVIRPAFGQLTIREITTALLDNVVREWKADGRPTRAYNARLQLHACFKRAVQLGVLTVNPVREVDAVKRAEPNARAITNEELARLWSATEGWDMAVRPGRKNPNPMCDVVLVLALTGCRIGEALALRFADIDWDANILAISGTVEELTGKRKDSTKSKNGMRPVKVPDELIAMLRRRYTERTTDNTLDAVFATSANTWLAPSNVRKIWRAIRESADLDWVEPRNFRVTAGTRIAEQFGAVAASQVLGNTEAIIRKHYMDPSAVARPDASDVLSGLGRGQGR
jgi:integrase